MFNSVYRGFWWPGETGYIGSSFLDNYKISESRTIFTVPEWSPFWKYRSFGIQHHTNKEKPYNLKVFAQILQEYKFALVFYDDIANITRKIYFSSNDDIAMLETFLEKNKPCFGETRMENFENKSGVYIGDAKFASLLYSKGIFNPQPKTKESKICSIGYSNFDNKWYGWSHRTLYGFTVGSECKKGDCHYFADTKEGLIENAISFWSEPSYKDVTASKIKKDKDGNKYVTISWSYNDKANSVDHFLPKLGKGEWIAESIEDARQMAIDFSDGVS